ncbi:AlpA family phage regulatory protein [Luteimonas aestuarii]|uniref:AlpA family phage regulatory protein n=1 Tax=Luteimonas aestuarii TaxID=453837 RepID=A0A4R5TYL6_9GAMM|nr:AlpA family phage regulatory protein [Luteimonas aestuarii]TDK26337.1 AlpA family phage regulatory protein [Luteimonas aestuarii]
MDIQQTLDQNTPSPADSTDNRLLIPIEDVCHLVGLGKSQIYAMIREGKFPQRVQLGLRCSRWRMAAIRAWVDGL